MSFYTRFGVLLLGGEALCTVWNYAQGNTAWVVFGVALMAATVVQLFRTA